MFDAYVHVPKVLSKLGYTQITVLDHGQTATVADGRMTVTAVEGASLRPLGTLSSGSVWVGYALKLFRRHAAVYSLAVLIS